MSCCKAEEYKWCQELPIVHREEDGKEYCIFHAPQYKKGVGLTAFNEAVLEKVDFAKARNTICELSGTVFEGDISFYKIEFPELSFRNATFSEKADFSDATFSGEADFSNATFSGAAYFFDATFSGAAYFSGATFSGEADFSDATFSGAAYFSGATFSGAADFWNATFSGAADFRLATFSGAAYFSGATFSGAANFSNAKFSGAADFFDIKFKKATIFTGTQFNGYASFSGETFTGKETIKLDRLRIKDNIHFVGVNLKQASFLDTDLVKVDFVQCELPEIGTPYIRLIKWLKICHKMWLKPDDYVVSMPKTKGYSRKILYDEKGALKAENKGTAIEHVETLYRRLKQKCSMEHNWPDVSNWHYGEKEMKRISGFRHRYTPLSIPFLYWASSGYAERPVRAAVWLGGFIFLFSWLTYRFGVTPLNCSPEQWICHLTWQTKPVDTLLAYLLNTLQYATFQKTYYFEPLTSGGAVVKALVQLVIPVQAALLVLAVRNRYRR